MSQKERTDALQAYHDTRRPVAKTLDAYEEGNEVHVLDFSGDLYDRTLEVSFLAKLRDERRFSGAPELVQQIAADVREARERFGGLYEGGIAGRD